MKKLTCFLMLLALITTLTKAQIKPDTKSFYTASSTGPGLSVCITIDSSTRWIEFHNRVANQPLNNYVFLKGTQNITVIGYLPKDSLRYYRYNITEDDSKLLVENATPDISKKMAVEAGGDFVNINFGVFNVENKKLTIETYKITSPSLVKNTIIYNKEIQPAEIIMMGKAATNKKGDFVHVMPKAIEGYSFPLHDADTTVTALDFVIKPTDMAFVYRVYIKNMVTGQRVAVSNNWMYDYFVGGPRFTPLPYISVNASFFSTPGDYKLQIVPTLPGGYSVKSFPEKTVTYHFTVLRSGKFYQEKTVIEAGAIVLVITACIVLVIFYIVGKRNKARLTDQKQQKDMVQLQLDAVRSQLNPHFLFNALSGIQNLMNKTEIDQANRYLAKFARLTRNVLNNRELIDLSEEKTLLDDYLQMEQMRFGFDYTIRISPDLDVLNIQIPSMLLQPFVENAVKHGLTNKDGARIAISIIKNNNDIALNIADNGKGFDTGKQSDGLGMQLSKKRIALLNTIYKDSALKLDVQSGANGTTVRITLTHWL